jgi:hypothetical protein
MLNCAGKNGMLAVAKVLRQRYSASWPLYSMYRWQPELQHWAVGEGAEHTVVDCSGLPSDSDSGSDDDFGY